MDYVKRDGAVVPGSWMDAVADAAEAGELPGEAVRTEVGPGRPRAFEGDELENVTFRMRKSRIAMMESEISRTGQTRSDFLREAVDEKLGRLATA